MPVVASQATTVARWAGEGGATSKPRDETRWPKAKAWRCWQKIFLVSVKSETASRVGKDHESSVSGHKFCPGAVIMRVPPEPMRRSTAAAAESRMPTSVHSDRKSWACQAATFGS